MKSSDWFEVRYMRLHQKLVDVIRIGHNVNAYAYLGPVGLGVDKIEVVGSLAQS